ncbi:MAG: YkgJ family cysteine cluster protein, partial [Deltaproteobacteria bacterium]|nr:YkgJ family cysteine cluster protein [Deltaproteobacteria bacterium]
VHLMLEKKIAALEEIYTVYDKFINTRNIACKKHCADCCSANVTITSLQGYQIVQRLIASSQSAVIKGIQKAEDKNRFQPQTTINQLAALYSNGVEPPAESPPTQEEACLLLSKNECSLYELRPFGCRCLVSRHSCAQAGYAQVDEFTLSVNTVFLQTIEHLDCQGCTGNLVDVLQTMSSERHRAAYSCNALHCSSNRLIPNQPMKVLMIPPEYRQRIVPILEQLRQIKIN